MRLHDLTGQRFGNLLVRSRGYNIGPHAGWTCECDCGQVVTVRAQTLKRGDTRSCGCLRKTILRQLRTTHGMHDSPTYHSWLSMLARCNNPKHEYFKNYGGRGISAAPEWLTFDGFFRDMGERPAERTLDRIDNNTSYCKSNCRWATRLEQSRNRRNVKSMAGGQP